MRKGDLSAHVRQFHLKLKAKKCDLCGDSVKNLKEHQQIKHSELFDCFLCEICSFSSKTATGLYTHSLQHETKKHQCPYDGCLKQFPFAFKLKNHIEKIHEKQLNETCEFCGKMFFKKRQLLVHQQHVHFSVKKKCPVQGCEKTFHRRGYCRDHIKKHLEINEEEKAKYWLLAAEMFPNISYKEIQ
jgi:hypothetical protein